MALFSGPKSAIGLDIGSSSVRAAEVTFDDGKRILSRIGEVGLAPGIVSEGEVHDPEALAAALSSLWKLAGFKSRKVFLGLANQKVIVRHIQLPYMSEEDLKGAINYEAQEYIPIPLDEAILDYQVIREYQDDDNRLLEILVVAAQKTMIDSFVQALSAAKLSPIAIDVQSFALLRSVVNVSEMADSSAGPHQVADAICLVDMSAGITNLVVATLDEPLFSRFIPLGGDYFTKSISDYTGLHLDEAERLKIEIGLPPVEEEDVYHIEESEITMHSEGATDWQQSAPGPLPAMDVPVEPAIESPADGGLGGAASESTSPQGGSEGVEPADADAVEPAAPVMPDLDEEEKEARVKEILARCAANFIDELRRSLDYFLSQPNAKPINKIILTGGAGQMRNLREHVSRAYNIPAEFGYPLSKMDVNKTKYSDEELMEMEPRLAIAIGLALYEEDF